LIDCGGGSDEDDDDNGDMDREKPKQQIGGGVFAVTLSPSG
jgi:hypothetical protein